RHTASLIHGRRPDIQVDLVTIKTKGDKILDAPLALIGGKGLFTKEIEDALSDGRVDLAVHSMKDLPTELPPGLKLGAVMRREDPRDVFISGDGRLPEELESGARVGTSSLRRKAFLLNRYPFLEIVPIRGNVETRLRKIETENLAGVVLASAGIKRLGYADKVTAYMEPDVVLPAIGQGAIGMEIRDNDLVMESLAAELNDPETAACVRAERAFLRRMGGGCQVPMAAHAVVADGVLSMTAAVVHPEGRPILRDHLSGPIEDPSIGALLADQLIAAGADAIMKVVQGEDWEPGGADFPAGEAGCGNL
ncbi:MAG: hydroxymethylbilane synthase, partial [Pseudomonadota bacterium]